MEAPVKMDDLGVPEFAKPPYRWTKMKDSPEKTGSAPSTRPEKPSLLEVEAILCISLHVFFHWTTCSQWGISDPDPRYIFIAQHLTLTCVLGSKTSPLDSSNEAEVKKDDAFARHSAEAGVLDFLSKHVREVEPLKLCMSLSNNGLNKPKFRID